MRGVSDNLIHDVLSSAILLLFWGRYLISAACRLDLCLLIRVQISALYISIGRYSVFFLDTSFMLINLLFMVVAFYCYINPTVYIGFKCSTFWYFWSDVLEGRNCSNSWLFSLMECFIRVFDVTIDLVTFMVIDLCSDSSFQMLILNWRVRPPFAVSNIVCNKEIRRYYLSLPLFACSLELRNHTFALFGRNNKSFLLSQLISFSSLSTCEIDFWLTLSLHTACLNILSKDFPLYSSNFDMSLSYHIYFYKL